MHANCNKDNGKLSKDHRKQDDYDDKVERVNPQKKKIYTRIPGKSETHTLYCHLTNWSSDFAQKMDQKMRKTGRWWLSGRP